MGGCRLHGAQEGQLHAVIVARPGNPQLWQCQVDTVDEGHQLVSRGPVSCVMATLVMSRPGRPAAAGEATCLGACSGVYQLSSAGSLAGLQLQVKLPVWALAQASASWAAQVPAVGAAPGQPAWGGARGRPRL